MPAPETTTAGAIIAGMVAIAAAIRWSVGVLAKSQNRAVTALIENAKTSATLTAKFDSMMTRFEGLTARFDRIVEALLRDPRMDDSQRARLATRTKRKDSKDGRDG